MEALPQIKVEDNSTASKAAVMFEGRKRGERKDGLESHHEPQ